MKAVVLEVRGGYAAVLKEDGTVEKIRRSCAVGDTIELTEEAKIVAFPKKPVRWVAAAAAALVILSAGGTYGYNTAYAYSYVTLDANPSLEYVLNRQNRVLSISALNEDAEAIAEALNDSGIRRATLTEAIEETTELLYEADYLGEDSDNCLLVSVNSHGKRQQESLTEEVDAYFSARGDEKELTVYVTDVTREERQQADALGVSAGRYKLMEDILGQTEQPTEAEAERIGSAPVRELLEEGGHRERSEAAAAGDVSDEPETPREPAEQPQGGASDEPVPEQNDMPQGFDESQQMTEMPGASGEPS